MDRNIGGREAFSHMVICLFVCLLVLTFRLAKHSQISLDLFLPHGLLGMH